MQYAREPRPRPYTGPDLPDTAIGNFPGGVDRSFRFGRPFFLPVNDATDQRFQAADTLTLVRGAHVVKAGGEVNWTSMTQVFQGFARGRYIFTGGMDAVRGVHQQPDVAGRALGVRALPAARAARRPIDRGLRPSEHPGLGAGVLHTGQVERAAEHHGERRPAVGRAQVAADADAAIARRRSRATSTIQRSRPTPARSPSDWSGWQPAPRHLTGIRAATARPWSAARPASSKPARPAWSGPTRAPPTASSSRTIPASSSDPGPRTSACRPSRTLVDTADFANVNPGISVVDKDFKNPQSRQLEPGVEREVTADLAVGAAFNYANTIHLSRFNDPNVDFSFTTNAEGRRIYAGTASPNRPFPTLGRGADHRQHRHAASIAALVLTAEQALQRSLAAPGQLGHLRTTTPTTTTSGIRLRSGTPISSIWSREYSLSDRHSRHRLNVFGALRSAGGRSVDRASCSTVRAQSDDRHRSDRTGRQQRRPGQRSPVRQWRATSGGTSRRRTTSSSPWTCASSKLFSWPRSQSIEAHLRGVQPHEQREQHRVADQRRAAVRLQRHDPQRHRRSAPGPDRRPLPLFERAALSIRGRTWRRLGHALQLQAPPIRRVRRGARHHGLVRRRGPPIASSPSSGSTSSAARRR